MLTVESVEFVESVFNLQEGQGFCFECDREVTGVAPGAKDLACPHCGSDGLSGLEAIYDSLLIF